MNSKFKIGILGLGAMGYPIANHILDSGYELKIFKNSNKPESLKKINDLLYKNAILCEKIEEFPVGLDIILSILPGDNEIKDVFLNDKFIDNIQSNTIILEMSSASVDTILQINDRYISKNIKIIDAPVSGGVQGAINGQLTIFGSGDREIFSKIEDFLKVFGKNIYYIGEVGLGKALKSVNQIMISINTLGLIEAYSLAKKYGIDPEIMEEVIGKSSGDSYSLHRYIDRLKEENFDGGFKLSLMRKDISVALDSANDLPLPLTNLLKNFFLMAKEYDELDFSAISKLYK